MTTTIYNLDVEFNQVGSVDAVLITMGSEGAGYTSAPTIMFSGGSGAGAAATANLASTGVNKVDIISGGTYPQKDPLALNFNWSSPDETGSLPIVGNVTFGTFGDITSITLSSAGSGYTSAPTLGITEDDSFEAGSFTPVLGTLSTLGTSVGSATVTNGGANYTSAPTVVFSGPQEAGSTTLGTATIAEYNVDEDILSSDISITEEMLRWGGGGILRLYFAFDLNDSTGVMGVINNGSHIGNLNPDHSSEITTDGYYRFDIGIEGGDNINLQLQNVATESDELVGIHFISAQLVIVGA